MTASTLFRPFKSSLLRVSSDHLDILARDLGHFDHCSTRSSSTTRCKFRSRLEVSAASITPCSVGPASRTSEIFSINCEVASLIFVHDNLLHCTLHVLVLARDHGGLVDKPAHSGRQDRGRPETPSSALPHSAPPWYN